MKHRSFYIILSILILFDSVLLASPNLLGKIGIIIYKYHHLRNFPRAFLTVSIVCGIVVLITILINALFEKQLIDKAWMLGMMYFLVGLIMLYYAKLIYDFSKWSYSQTGWRFKSGVYLLPFILLYIVGYRIWLVKFRGISAKGVQVEENLNSIPEENTKEYDNN